MRKTRSEKAITLIALIITIIILLILAVVTIGSIKDSNIITYAQNAATDYNDKKTEEEGILSDYETIIKENIPSENGSSEIGNATVGTKTTKNSTINGEQYSSTNPIIPAGYAPINIIGDHASSWDKQEQPEVSKGLVITDDTTTRDEYGNTIGNEFVWVPVYNINQMIMCQSCGAIAGGINEETLQCKVCGANTKLSGIVKNQTTYSENGYREPDVLTELYNPETSEFEDVATLNVEIYLEKAGMQSGSTLDDFKNQLQKEFNEMAASVAKYKGFYVGRYETSINGTVPQSKCGVVSATAAANSANTWYGLYKLNKEYTTSSVKSSMIWGSQYDAMMRWMEDDAKNFNPLNRNLGRETGSKLTDVIRNVYDLGGNSYECTLEMYDDSERVTRGGYYKADYMPSDRNWCNPAVDSIYMGSRLTLCIV